MAAKSSKQLPWIFSERVPGAVQTDPFEEEFFIGPSDNELDDGHVASLVRESVQNALDARVGSGPVRVRFALNSASVAATGAIGIRQDDVRESVSSVRLPRDLGICLTVPLPASANSK